MHSQLNMDPLIWFWPFWSSLPTLDLHNRRFGCFSTKYRVWSWLTWCCNVLFDACTYWLGELGICSDTSYVLKILVTCRVIKDSLSLLPPAKGRTIHTFISFKWVLGDLSRWFGHDLLRFEKCCILSWSWKRVLKGWSCDWTSTYSWNFVSEFEKPKNVFFSNLKFYISSLKSNSK